MNESTPVTAAVDARTRARLDADAAQLKALGYTSKFDRTMSELENFSLGFTYLSPGSGRLQLVSLRARRWRSADVLVVPARRYRPAVRLPGVR